MNTLPITRSRHLSRAILFLVAAAASLALACGSDDEAEVQDGPGFAPPTVSVPDDLPPARATSAPDPGAAGLIVNPGGPELTGNQEWFNSEPTSIGTLIAEGEVVLVDFWTYTCINCIRTLPFLTEWDRKYGERGLTILGVHSPEFEFEKVPGNVQGAIARYGIKYPVVQDNEMATWNAFTNRYWPAKYLFDTGGNIIYSHFGEGDYVGTEQHIRAALELAGHNVSDIPIGTAGGPKRDPLAVGQTRELYGGWGRNYSYNGLYAGQPEFYDNPDQLLYYEDNLPRQDGQWYAQGTWLNEREAIVHGRETTDFEDYLVFKFLARSVNVVINPVVKSEPFPVIVEIDGRPVKASDSGTDIEYDDEGRSFITVESGREYRVVELEKWGERELTLRVNSPDFAMFAVTFGNNLQGA